jgi:hypothetical protein
VCRVDVTGAGPGDDRRREGWNGVRRLREGECVVLVRDGGGEDDSDSDPDSDKGGKCILGLLSTY